MRAVSSLGGDASTRPALTRHTPPPCCNAPGSDGLTVRRSKKPALRCWYGVSPVVLALRDARASIERTVDSRYAIVTLAILIPEGVETEEQMRAYLAWRLEQAQLHAIPADQLPQDGDRWH